MFRQSIRALTLSSLCILLIATSCLRAQDSPASQQRSQAVAGEFGTQRMVIAGPGYMWGIDRQLKAELEAAGMKVLAYPDVPMVDGGNQPPRIRSWEQLSQYNVLIFGDPFLNSAEPDPLTGKLPAWVDDTVGLLRRFLEEGGGIFFCGNGEANFANVIVYNHILKELGLDAQVIGELVLDPSTQVSLTDGTGRSSQSWFWTDAIGSGGALTKGVSGLWYPLAYGGDGGLGLMPVRVGSNWQVLVRGLPSAASYALNSKASANGPTVLNAKPGTVKSSPILIAARQYKKGSRGRVVLWPMWTRFSLIAGSTPGVGGHLMDGEHEGKRSDGARLLENLLCWLAEPSQGSTAIGLFDETKPRPAPTAHVTAPDLSDSSPLWMFPQGEKRYARQFKGLIGAHSNLSDGESSPQQMIEAAKQAGYDFIAFTEDLAQMDKVKYDTLVTICKKANAQDATFVAFAGLDFLTDAGDRNLAFGMPNWLPDDRFSSDHPGRLPWLYALAYQDSNVPSKWPAMVVMRSKTNNKRPWIQGFWGFFAPYCYEGGELVDDSMDEWLPLVGLHGFHSVADLMAVHTVRSSEQIKQAADPGLYQTIVRANSESEIFDKLMANKYYRVESANYISTGPVIESFRARIIGIGEGANLSIPGNNRGDLYLKVSSDVGIKQINIYDGQRLVRRFTPDANSYEATITFHYDTIHVYTMEVIDQQDRRALSWTAWAGVYDRVHRRGGDNWNWMTTGKPHQGQAGYTAWNGMEVYGGSADVAHHYAADQANYMHNGLRMTWFDVYLASRNQGGLLVDGKHGDRYPSRTMDFITVGQYGAILVNRFLRDLVVDTPTNSTIREFSGPYTEIPSAWPAEMTEYIPNPRFNGTQVARSVGEINFAREVSTPSGQPVAINLGLTTEYSINPTNSEKGILEVVSADGSSQLYKLADLPEGGVYKGEIPVNGYVCWYGPDAPGIGGIIALSPGLRYTYSRTGGTAFQTHPPWRGPETRLDLLMKTPSPAKAGTQVKWDCLLVTGSTDANNSRHEMDAIVQGMGIVGTPTLYQVQTQVGKIIDQKFSLTIQTDDHGFSGTIARTTDELTPIPIPVMVKGLNPRWDACLWYRGQTELEVVRKFRDPWGVENPYRMTGVYEPRTDELQFIPVIDSDTGYCQVNIDKQASDVFIGNPLVCDNESVFITLVKAKKSKCVFKLNNPTDQSITCTVRPSKGFDLAGTFEETVVLKPGQLKTITAIPDKMSP